MKLILVSFGLAVLYCLPPGAVTAAALKSGVRSGFAAALGVELGSVLGDGAYGALALAGLGFVLRWSWAHVALGLLGVVVMTYLGVGALKQARRPVAPAAHGDADGFRRAFGIGVALGLANPLGIPFWLSFGGGVLSALHIHQASVGTLWAFFLSFVAGCTLWGIGMAVALASLRHLFTPRVLQGLSALAGIALIGFACVVGVQTL
jgi:chemosensory pili system protein ChpE